MQIILNNLTFQPETISKLKHYLPSQCRHEEHENSWNKLRGLKKHPTNHHQKDASAFIIFYEKTKGTGRLNIECIHIVKEE